MSPYEEGGTCGQRTAQACSTISVHISHRPFNKAQVAMHVNDLAVPTQGLDNFRTGRGPALGELQFPGSSEDLE